MRVYVCPYILPFRRPSARSAALDCRRRAKGGGGGGGDAPALLRAMLLRSRKGTCVLSTAPQSTSTASPALSLSSSLSSSSASSSSSFESTGAAWHTAFVLFRDAIVHDGVVPTMPHINLLLHLTVREQRWPQHDAVVAFARSFPSLIPTAETYDCRMAAAVGRGLWGDALRCFAAARHACHPISDSAIRLALIASRGNGAKSHVMENKEAAAESPSILSSSSSLPLPWWDEARALFMSVRHRVREVSTVELYAEMMSDAGEHRAVLDTYTEFHARGFPLGAHMYLYACRAARVLGDVGLLLRVLDDALLHFTSNTDSPLSISSLSSSSSSSSMISSSASPPVHSVVSEVLESTLVALRDSGRYDSVIRLYMNLRHDPKCDARVWAGRAGVIVAQAALVRRDVRLLLHLLDADGDEPRVETCDAVLRAIQVELIHAHVESMAPKDGLSVLSLRVYEAFVRGAAARLLLLQQCPAQSPSLPAHDPLLRLLLELRSRSHRTSKCHTHPSPWQEALSHLSRVRRPDTLVVALAADVMARDGQCAAACVMLKRVAREAYACARRPNRTRHAAGQKQKQKKEEEEEGEEEDPYGCTVVTSAAVYCVARGNPGAAGTCVHMAFSRGWVDAAMAGQLLHGVESTRAAGHLIALHTRVMAGRRCITQPHPKDYEDHSANGMMEEMIPLLHDTSRVLRRLADPLEPPPTGQFRALTQRIESVLRCYGSKSSRTCDIPVLLHALWEGVGTANVSRWTLWPECVRTLQWFRSPFAPEARRGQAHNEGVKEKEEEEEEKKRKGKKSNDDGRGMDESHGGDGPFLEVTPETIRVLRAFMRCCDGPESEFITSVAADWLCANGRTPLPPLSHALSMSSWSSLVEAEAEASSRPLLLYASACDLLLDAVVWAGRHRRKGLLRRLLPLIHGIPTHRALHAYTVAAQCLTSGPHAEVLMDWPIVCIAIGRMTTTAAGAERKDDGALADSTAAVLDKLRRTFHFLIRKIALDAHRQRHTAVPAVSLSTTASSTTTTRRTTTAHTDVSTTSLSSAASSSSSSLPCTFSSTVELRAAAYMDLCEEFSRRLSAYEWARVCVEKAMECIWDVNYAFYVWYSTFCTKQTPSTAAAVRVVQDRYRRLMGTHIALLPASQLFAPARVERWLAVMSGGDANAAALVNDATALDAAPGTPAVFVVMKTINALTWRRVALDEAYAEQQQQQQRRVLHEKPTEEKNDRDTKGKEEVWRDAPVNRYAVEQRRHERSTVNAQGMDIEKHPLPPLPNGALPTSLFDDPAALLSWRHIHLMQRAGGALFLAALCEGRAGDCAVSVQWVMSWLHCPRHVLRTVSNILPRETLRAAWADAPAVFCALARQSALCGVVANEKKEEEKDEEEESQAAALLRLLLTSPAVQSIARVDAATAAAALLALRESDFKIKKVHTVTETAAASPVWMVCRLLAAFPRMLDTALLPRLVRGELCATQRRAIDTMTQCVCDVQSAAGPMGGGGGAPVRVAHAWRVVRRGVHEPCADSSRNDWGVGLDVDAAVNSAQHVFAKVMIGNEEKEEEERKNKNKKEKESPETRTAVRGQRNVLMSAVDWETARRALEAAQRLLNESPCSSPSHSHSYSLVEPFLMALECYGPHISVKWRDTFAATECARRQQQKQENKQEEQKQKEQEEQCWTLCETAHRLAWAPVSWQLLLCAPEQRENMCVELRRVAAAVTNSSSDDWTDIFAALHRRCCCHAWPLLPSDAPNDFCAAAAAVAAESAAVLERLAVCAMQSSADGAVAAAALLLLSSSSLSSSSVSMSVPRDHHHHLHLLPAVVFRLYCRCGLRGCLTEPITGTEAETISGQKHFSAAGIATCAPRPVLWRRFVDCASRLLRTAPLRHSAATECVSALALCLSADAACSNDPVMFADALRPIVDMAGDAVAVESDGAARRAAGLFVQSAMLAALWRPIYWLAIRLLPSCGQEGHMQHEAVTWPIALVPAVIMAAAMRTTSALQEETRTLLSRVPCCAELSPFVLDTLRNELLGSAASAGPLSRGTSFLARAAMVRPVLRAARLLLRPGRGVDFFFYLSDAQWRLLQRCLGALPSSFANLPNEHRVLSSSSHSHSYSSAASSGVPVSVSLSSGCGTASAVPSWETAVSKLCALPRESFHTVPTPNTCVTSSLRVFRSACLSDTMPWALVRDLFLSGHLPHAPHIFPALVSERAVDACASPAEARCLLRHSLTTVPSPTRVQQCIAYLILRRHRTDTAWAAKPMHTAPALFSTQDAGLLKDGIADSIGGKGLSWEMACWCHASVTGHGAPRLPQRHMSEVLRHCALDPTAAVKMYEAYWCAGYARVEGAHPFLTLLRAAGREAGSEALALRAMRDYVRCDDETVSAGLGPALTADGHAATVRAFARLCANGIVSAAAAAEVAEALRSRGRLGDVEELLLLVHRQTGNGKRGTQEGRERKK